jgi:GT2 family glycosyltransferase
MGRWLGSSTQARVSAVAGEQELLRLPPVERHRLCIFDNVCACIRRAVWERHPFPSTAIAEDLAWAKQVLLAGHRLAYVPDSVVIHSHERPVRYELWRTYLVHQRLRLLFELRTVPSALHLLRAMALSLAVHGRCLVSAHGARIPSRELARALGLAVAWPLGQYLGALSVETGRQYLRPRGV